MSLPSNNQVRQLFVALSEKANSASLANVGDTKIVAKTGDDGLTGPFRIQQIGHGGLVSSDLVDPKKIAYVKLTKAAALRGTLGVHEVTVTTAEAGQIYEIKLQFSEYIGKGAQDQTYRLGTYKAKTNDAAADIAAGLATSLQSAVAKENLCTIAVNGAKITITEVEQPWSRGRFEVAHMPIKVFLNGIFTATDYMTYEWATIVDSTTPASLVTVSQKVADLEYFCHGARGDEYRGMGYPRNIETKYMLTGTEANGFDLLDIHFFYQGSNEAVQKSEKDLTVVLPAAVSHTIVTELTAILTEVGIEIEVIPAS